MEVFVTRQPIFDRHDRVAGYELLYRRSPTSARAPQMVTPALSTRVIADAFLGIGVHRVTDGRPAYLNCGRELLLSGLLELFDPRHVVIELLETVEPDDEVIAACQALSEAGYRIALDDFEYRARWEPLLRIADVIKVDVLAHSPAELEKAVARLRRYNAMLLAEKVESAEVRDRCLRLGFDLFQGFHFRRPETVAHRDISVAQIRILKLMNLMRDLNIPDARLEDEFRADVPLSYKLLRMANSAAIGGIGIQSLGHAIRLLGRQPLYRWLSLLLLSSARRRGGIDEELVHASLVRARFAELTAQHAGRAADAGALFLIGLFARLDDLLGTPMTEILDQLVLDAPVREALLDRAGPYADLLNL